MTKSLYSSKSKTHGSKKRYVLSIYRTSDYFMIKQHWYCDKRDAHKDMNFLTQMVDNLLSFKLEEAAIPNPLWVGGENKMLESQLADLSLEEIKYD